MRSKCPHCGKFLVDSGGSPDAKWMIVGEFGSWEEIREGLPFVGRTGDVLSAELGRLGLPLSSFRLTNLWQHAKDEKECKLEWHVDQLAKELKGRTHVLLCGSDVVKALMGNKAKVSNYSGTRITLPDFKGVRFWVSPNPAIVFHSPIGELRLSLERFAKDLK